MSTENDDLPLVRQALEGNGRAFEELVCRYEGALYRLSWRMLRNAEEAQDVVQETFLRVYRALGTFDQTRRFSTWILRIATNLCIDRYRRRKEGLISIEASEESEERRPIVLVDGDAPPDDRHRRQALAEMLDAQVCRLPPIYRVIIELRYKQGLAYEEIGEVLRVPLGTVKARLHRAHRQLRELVQSAGIDPDSLEP